MKNKRKILRKTFSSSAQLPRVESMRCATVYLTQQLFVKERVIQMLIGVVLSSTHTQIRHFVWIPPTHTHTHTHTRTHVLQTPYYLNKPTHIYKDPNIQSAPRHLPVVRSAACRITSTSMVEHACIVEQRWTQEAFPPRSAFNYVSFYLVLLASSLRIWVCGVTRRY